MKVGKENLTLRQYVEYCDANTPNEVEAAVERYCNHPTSVISQKDMVFMIDNGLEDMTGLRRMEIELLRVWMWVTRVNGHKKLTHPHFFSHVFDFEYDGIEYHVQYNYSKGYIEVGSPIMYANFNNAERAILALKSWFSFKSKY